MPLVPGTGRRHTFFMPRFVVFAVGWLLAILICPPARATILWSDPGSRVIHLAATGSDILGGKVKRDGQASGVRFFKFHVDPLSDVSNEPYLALFQLVETNQFRLGVGNALEAWGYSAAYTSETGPSNRLAGEYNLRSAHPEASRLGEFQPYELPNHNHDKTIVFRVQYISGADAMVTVWLDPNLTHGATAENQPESITTQFKANACFDEIRLRHDGGGNGWGFSDMAVATSFNDFVVVYFWQTWWFDGGLALFILGSVIFTVRVWEKRKFQLQLQRMERQHALEQERTRIAQDLHDELGSLLTRISLLGGLLQADRHNPAQVEVQAEKIVQSADQTVLALEEIVWAVRPGSDTLQSLVDYMVHFANETFSAGKMRCRLDFPPDLPAQALPPDVRHNIFLIGKEALTNVLKHSRAAVVNFQIKVADRELVMVIADDGRGFDLAAAATNGRHNGLVNMRRRAEAVGGQLTFITKPGQGARVEFRVKFPG